MLEKDSADSPKGSWSGPDDFPEGEEPALFGHDNPGKHSLGASSAQDLPGAKLKAEISVARSLLCCALSQLPSRYPLLDRLTHHCHIFEMNGESDRFRESMKAKKSRKAE